MACDTRPMPGQTLSQRKEQVRETLAKLASDLSAGRVKAVVGPQGAIAFQGWQDRANVTDACAYRLLMVSGTATAKLAIQRAEQLAGRTVNRQAIAQGHHGHSDGHGGISWHHGH